MSSLDYDLVLASILGLSALAAGAFGLQFRSRFVGPIAGVLTFLTGIATLFLHPNVLERSFLLLDGASLPRVAVAGVMLWCVFMVLPRRHESETSTSSLLALAAVHIALVVSPEPWISAVLWVLGAFFTAVVLPAGPARRLAIPYLLLSSVVGVIGLFIGGPYAVIFLLLAVMTRMGIFPFHSWVVGIYTLAPTTIAVALVAPMAALSLVARTPLAMEDEFGIGIAVFLVLGALLTGALSIVQRTLSRGVGMLTVSIQTSVLLGVLEGDNIGHLGGLMMWGITGLSLLGIGLVAAALISRRGEIRIDTYAGLLERAPIFGALFLMFGLAAVGAPGTADFASEDLVLHGGMAHHPVLLFLFISALSTQGYSVLHLFYRVFFGPPDLGYFQDAMLRERIALVGLAALLVLLGLAPQILIDGWLLAG